MEKDLINGLMDQSLKEIGKMEKQKGAEFTNILMEEFMKEAGDRI